MSKEDFETWLLGGAAFGLCAGIMYGLVKAVVALVAPVSAALLTTVAWLLSILISALLSIGAVLVVLGALKFATTSVVDSIKASLAKMSNDRGRRSRRSIARLFGGGCGAGGVFKHRGLAQG